MDVSELATLTDDVWDPGRLKGLRHELATKPNHSPLLTVLYQTSVDVQPSGTYVIITHYAYIKGSTLLVMTLIRPTGSLTLSSFICSKCLKKYSVQRE